MTLKTSSITQYSSPRFFCNNFVQRSSTPNLPPVLELYPCVFESPKHKIFFCSILFSSCFLISRQYYANSFSARLTAPIIPAVFASFAGTISTFRSPGAICSFTLRFTSESTYSCAMTPTQSMKLPCSCSARTPSTASGRVAAWYLRMTSGFGLLRSLISSGTVTTATHS